MKKYIVLTMLSILTCITLGKEKSSKNPIHKSPPIWLQEARLAAGSNYVETFAQAFNDPNILIGVFERPLDFSYTTLSSGEVLERLPGYYEALNRFSLRRLKCIKSIKGTFPEPVCLCPMELPPTIERKPSIPPFGCFRGSKWVLALKKTTKESRLSRYGDQDIEKYTFINDRTMFEVFRYGHGTLCLKWQEYKEGIPQHSKPSFVVQVPESIINDLEAIVRVIPHTQKEKIDPNGVAVMNQTSKMLKTDAAKSIFTKILNDKLDKVQDPNEPPSK